MNIYSFYSLASGQFSGLTIQCVPDHLPNNVPEDCGCVLGVYDALSQRVDLDSGEVIDFQPPQPSENHDWNSESRRWLYVKTDADIAAEIRAERERLLSASDWMVLRAAEGIPMPMPWAEYRANLRNITSQPGFPRNVEWPVKPEGI